MSRPRCLVLRALGLGDLLTGVPALRALRRGLPRHRLVLAAPAGLAPLVELADVADELLHTPGLGDLDWSGPPPEIAIDLHGNGPASKAPLLALRPRRLVAFAGIGPDGRHVSGPPWRRDEHETRRWCRLVRQGCGLRVDPTDLRIERLPGSRPPGPGPILIHPGAAAGSRRWPADRFAEVAARLGAQGQVVVTGTPDEAGLARAVLRGAGLPAERSMAGRTDLAQLARLVASARLVVCGDTGIAHLASAFGTPSVVLFGPTPPAWWGPPPDGPHLVLWKGATDARGGIEHADPHATAPDQRLLRITAEEVVAAASEMMSRSAAGSGGWPLHAGERAREALSQSHPR